MRVGETIEEIPGRGGSWNYGTEKYDKGEDQAEGASVAGEELNRREICKYTRTRAG